MPCCAPSPFTVANIRARFLQPLYLDEVRIRPHPDRTDSQIEFEIVAADTVVALVKLSSRARKIRCKIVQPAISAPRRCRSPPISGLEQLAGQAGAVAIGEGGARSLFPALTRRDRPPGGRGAAGDVSDRRHGVPRTALAVCRSRRSPAIRNGGQEAALAYAVTKDRCAIPLAANRGFAASGIAGRLDAFARPAPPSQPGDGRNIAPRSPETLLRDKDRSSIGGSRGLGEVTAKIVAAGGGRPVITYQESAREAERVAAEIPEAAAMRHPALRCAVAGARTIATLGAVDCCYYFATPKIFQRKSALYEPEKLRAFLSFYADGFFDLCSALASRGTGKIAVFYPSTVAIDEARQHHRGICDGEVGRRDPGEASESNSCPTNPRLLPPPAPDPDRSNRNRRRCQRRQRVGRHAAHCI